MVDEATKKTLTSIPLLKTHAGPRDGDQWVLRLKEEYLSLIKVRAMGGIRRTVFNLLIENCANHIAVSIIFINYCSTYRTTRTLTTTGLGWSRTKMAQSK